ncbi:izumo sperm-egg fusion protein 1 isoform X1 [Syngnathoides biaculeatus]|uniref:izumo sperm-egg fusion protein 1 isoform X1 n=1 Tax=Syngnathoides biaculeatus TaxID=300417 RepID=UPI002ADD39FD|nr:izumo sperm-egg fusion protein 1 isoform X1 [Syngnathoides biaculeatus]
MLALTTLALTTLVLMLRGAAVTEACLQCDRKIVNTNEDFSLSSPSMEVQINLKLIIQESYNRYKKTSQERKGVIDPTTLYRVKTEYLSEFERSMKANTGPPHTKLIRVMNDGDRMLGKHLDKFIGERLCPNQCGLLKRRVMDCTSCKYRMYSCPSPSGKVDCGEHPMRAEEGGQAVLDCFRPWHSLLLGSPEYHYTWAPAVSGDAKLNESDFRNVVVMEDSSLVLNQLHVSDQGVYRCSLEGQDGAVFYRVAFPLTVTPGPTRRPRASVKRPAPAPEDDGSLFQSSGGALATLMAVVSALSLAGSLVFVAVIVRVTILRKNTSQRESRRVEEENNASTFF